MNGRHLFRMVVSAFPCLGLFVIVAAANLVDIVAGTILHHLEGWVDRADDRKGGHHA